MSYALLYRVTGTGPLDGVTRIPTGIVPTVGPDGERQVVVPSLGLIDPGELNGLLDAVVVLSISVISEAAEPHAVGADIFLQSQTTPEITVGAKKLWLRLSDASYVRTTGLCVPRGHLLSIDTTVDGGAPGPHMVRLTCVPQSMQIPSRIVPLPLPLTT